MSYFELLIAVLTPSTRTPHRLGVRYGSHMFTTRRLLGWFTAFTLITACQQSAPERGHSPLMRDASNSTDSPDAATPSSRDASIAPPDAQPNADDADDADDDIDTPTDEMDEDETSDGDSTPPMDRPDAMPTSSDCEAGTGWNGTSCMPCLGSTFSDGSHACRRWTDCPAGSFVTAEPDASRDRTCERCPTGTLSFSPNQEQCPPLEPSLIDTTMVGRIATCTLNSVTHEIRCAGAFDAPSGIEFASIDGANDYACGLEAATGLAFCWGATDIEDGCYTAPAAANETFEQIAVGAYGGCGIAPDKRTVCWWDELSMLQAAGLLEWCDRDHGECPEVLDPIPAPPVGVEFRALSVGDLFACGIISENSHVECWGLEVPVPPADVAFESIDVGVGYGCGVRQDNRQVLCWGANESGQADAPSDVLFDSVQVGEGAACGLRAESNDAVCWGQLPSEPTGTAFSSLGVSGTRACGTARVDGALHCWDSTGDAALTGGPYSSIGVECRIRALDQRAVCVHESSLAWGTIPDITAVALDSVAEGRNHVCGIRSDDFTALCWGDDAFGQASPPAGIAFQKLSAGESFTCGIRVDDSHVECWGLAEDGRLAPPERAYSELSVGRYHACAIRVSDGRVDCWGSDSGGEARAPDANFERISAGNGETCGIETGTGLLRCWGGWQAEVPDGAFDEVDVGAANACAIRSGDHFARCWPNPDSQSYFIERDYSTPLAAISDEGCGITEQSGALACWNLWEVDSDNEDPVCPSDAELAVEEYLEQGECVPPTADATVDVREARAEYCHMLERCAPEQLVLYAGGNLQGCLDYERCRGNVRTGTVTHECLAALAAVECGPGDYFAAPYGQVYSSPLCTFGGQTLQARTAGQSCWASVCRTGSVPTEGVGCDEGLYCDRDDTCAPYTAAGQPCSIMDEPGVTIDPCEPETYCDARERRCLPQAAPEEACVPSVFEGGRETYPCVIGYCEDGFCTPAPLGGVPTPGLGLGEACTPGDCLLGLGCDGTGVCSPMQCEEGPR